MKIFICRQERSSEGEAWSEGARGDVTRPGVTFDPEKKLPAPGEGREG